jgi:stage III sporulation protein AB
VSARLLGAAAILFIGILLGRRGSAAFFEHIRQLEGFLLLLRHVRERIACFHTPKKQIFPSFRNAALERAGVLSGLAEGDLTAALLEARGALYLDEGEMAILLELSEGLGQGYLAEELSRCDLAVCRLEAALAAAREATPRKARIVRTVSVSGALALVLVFL